MSGIHFVDGLWALVVVAFCVAGFRWGCILCDRAGDRYLDSLGDSQQEEGL